MICKQEVCAWFKGLTGAKRIDLMCGLLQICLAPELRFIGSCLEAMCRKDYNALRALEVEANNIQHIQTLTSDLLDSVMRAKWNLVLALLDSENTLCANALYSVLCNCVDKVLMDIMQLQKNDSSTSNYKEVLDDILLLFTMASNHPAFSFSDKLELDSYLTKLQALQEEFQQQSCKERSSISSQCRPYTTSVQPQPQPLDSTDVPETLISVVDQLSTADDGSIGSGPKEVNGHTIQGSKHSKHHNTYSSSHSKRKQEKASHLYSNGGGGGAADNNEAYHQQSPRKTHSSPISIKGGGGELGEEDSDGILNSRGAIATQIIYNSTIAPDHRTPPQQTTGPPVSPRGADLVCSPGRSPLASSNLLTTHPPAPASYHNVMLGGPTSPIPSSPLSSSHSSPHESPSSSAHTSSSSSSSCSSSVSSSAGVFPTTVAGWLKRIRLHKYTDTFQDCTFQELLQLTDADLEKLKLTNGAMKKIRKEIDKINLGGEQFQENCMMNGGTSPLTIWTPPLSDPCSSPYTSPQQKTAALTSPPAASITTTAAAPAAASSSASTPSSEYSSPPQSPCTVTPATTQPHQLQTNKDGGNTMSSSSGVSMTTSTSNMMFLPQQAAPPKSPCGSTASSGSMSRPDSINGDTTAQQVPPPPLPSSMPVPRPMLPMPLDYPLLNPYHNYFYHLAMANAGVPRAQMLRSPIAPGAAPPPHHPLGPPPPPPPVSTQPSPAPSPGSGLRSRPTSLHGLPPPSPPTMFLPSSTSSTGDCSSPGPALSSTAVSQTPVTFSTSFQGPVAATTSFCSYPPPASHTPPPAGPGRNASTPTPPPPVTPGQPVQFMSCCNHCGNSTPMFWSAAGFPPTQTNALLPMPPPPPHVMRPPHPVNGYNHNPMPPPPPSVAPAGNNTPPSAFLMPATQPPPYFMHHQKHGPGGKPPLTCFKCGQIGHRQMECKKFSMLPSTGGSMDGKTGFHLKYMPSVSGE